MRRGFDKAVQEASIPRKAEILDSFDYFSSSSTRFYFDELS